MEQRRNLCAHIPVSLHGKVREEQLKTGKSLSDYITAVLTEYYEGGGRAMSGKTRTLAFQVSEELFMRVKAYLTGHGKMSQKDFVVGLIEQAVTEWEATQITEPVTEPDNEPDNENAAADSEGSLGNENSELSWDGQCDNT